MKKAAIFGVIIGMLGLAPYAAAANIELEGPAVVPEFAELTVMHAIPGLPSDVEVYANGRFVQSFAYAERIGPVMIPGGDYTLEVRLDGVSVLNAEAELQAGVNYTAIAYLTDGGGIALGLYKNDTESLKDGSTRLTVRHTANAPEVDVRLLRGNSNLSDLVIRGFANSEEIGPLDIPAGMYGAAILAGGTEVANTGMLELEPGLSYVVYAVGTFPETFEFFVQTIKLAN